MHRGRQAVHLLLATGAAALVFVLGTSPGLASKPRFFTHLLSSVTGEYVNHWTINEPQACGLVGDGTVTVKFRMARALKVKLVMDRSAGSRDGSPGNWVVGVRYGGGTSSMRPQAATGAITLVDNTTRRPNVDGSPCGAPDKSDCGTTRLRLARVDLGGYNRHALRGGLDGVQFDEKGGHGALIRNCRSGEASLWDERLSGGTRRGELLLAMPSPSVVAHRGVALVGKTHKRTSFANCTGSGDTCSDDITRRFTATFRRL